MAGRVVAGCPLGGSLRGLPAATCAIQSMDRPQAHRRTGACTRQAVHACPRRCHWAVCCTIPGIPSRIRPASSVRLHHCTVASLGAHGPDACPAPRRRVARDWGSQAMQHGRLWQDSRVRIPVSAADNRPCMQDQHSAVASQLQSTHRRLDDATARHSDLVKERGRLSGRIAVAAKHLADLARRGHSAHHSAAQQPPHGAARAQQSHASSESASSRTAAGRTRAAAHADTEVTVSALLPRHVAASLHHHHTSTRQRYRPLSSYVHHACVCFDELVRLYGPDGRHGTGILASLEDFRWQATAAAGGCSTADVCWFVLLDKEASPGLRLSFSSTVCSPECVGSLALHYLALKLEAALLAAAMNSERGARRS